MLAKYGKYFLQGQEKKKKKHAKILPIVLFGVIVAVAGIASITVLGNVDTCKNQ